MWIAPRPLRLASAAAALALAAPAAAETTRPLEIAYAVHGDHLHVSYDVAPHLDARWIERVDSGLSAVLLVAAAVVTLGGDEETVAGTTRRCEIVYDLWAERYTVTLVEEARRRQFVAKERETAMRHCARPEAQRLVRVDALDLRRRYVVEVVVDVDPDRPEMRDRARQHIGDPSGARGDGSGGPSVFGAVVRALFRGGDEDGGHVVRLRGVPFGEPLVTLALDAAERRTEGRGGVEGEEE